MMVTKYRNGHKTLLLHPKIFIFKYTILEEIYISFVYQIVINKEIH